MAQTHAHNGQPLPHTVQLLPTTPQIRGLHTFIRNKDTPRDEFIFYSKRLIRLVIEYTLSLMMFNDKVVETPQGVLYKGKQLFVCRKLFMLILQISKMVLTIWMKFCFGRVLLF